jgi:hypothetical protein
MFDYPLHVFDPMVKDKHQFRCLHLAQKSWFSQEAALALRAEALAVQSSYDRKANSPKVRGLVNRAVAEKAVTFLIVTETTAAMPRHDCGRSCKGDVIPFSHRNMIGYVPTICRFRSLNTKQTTEPGRDEVCEHL